MRKSFFTVVALLIVSTVALQAQTAASIAGKYMDVKNKAILAIEPAGNGFVVRQISTPETKDKPMDGQIVAKITTVSGSNMAGVAISGGKEYQATWDIGSGGSTIAMRVKAGIFHFNANWKKCGTTCS